MELSTVRVRIETKRMPSACPGDRYGFRYYKQDPIDFRIPSGGFAAAGDEGEGKWPCVLAESGKLPRASRGHPKAQHSILHTRWLQCRLVLV